jgi:hypothetical protein
MITETFMDLLQLTQDSNSQFIISKSYRLLLNKVQLISRISKFMVIPWLWQTKTNSLVRIMTFLDSKEFKCHLLSEMQVTHQWVKDR